MERVGAGSGGTAECGAQVRAGQGCRVFATQGIADFVHGTSVQQFHRVPEHAVLFARSEHGNDGRMREPRDGFDLAAEAFASTFEVEQFGPHDLERDAAAQGFLVGFIDDTHAAAADAAQQVELAQPVREVTHGRGGTKQPHLAAASEPALKVSRRCCAQYF